MAEDWGSRGIDDFVSRHKDLSRIDPSKVNLSQPFVVCVIGASRGIGAGIAFAYARAGATGLVLASRRFLGLLETAAECRKIDPKCLVEVLSCDISDADQVDRLAKDTHKRFGRLDVIAVNSGYSGEVLLKVTDMDPVEFAQVTATNYLGTAYCLRSFVPLLLQTQNGAKAFIAIGSLAAMIVRGPIANTQYCISKTAQLRVMEYAHEQYHAQGLKAFIVHPGAVMTETAKETCPEVFLEYLTDSPDLAGSFCVWLTKDGDERAWLSGRQSNACWDTEELEAKREDIVQRDLLKLRMTL